jgi:RNA polymerase sigma factor (sigma-70 family)
MSVDLNILKNFSRIKTASTTSLEQTFDTENNTDKFTNLPVAQNETFEVKQPTLRNKRQNLVNLIEEWKKTNDTKLAGQIIDQLNPVFDGAMQTFVGYKSPQLRSKAKVIAMKALKEYDPKKGKLETYLYNYLRNLSRFARKHEQIINVPERVHLEKYTLDEVTREMEQELGREPSDKELCDRLGISPKRLAYIRKYNQPVSESGFREWNPTYNENAQLQQLVASKIDSLWLKTVYDELDPYHQSIMEYTLGLNGKPVLSNLEIAKKLNRTPGAISQAKKRIEEKLRQGQQFEDILGRFN